MDTLIIIFSLLCFSLVLTAWLLVREAIKLQRLNGQIEAALERMEEK